MCWPNVGATYIFSMGARGIVDDPTHKKTLDQRENSMLNQRWPNLHFLMDAGGIIDSTFQRQHIFTIANKKSTFA